MKQHVTRNISTTSRVALAVALSLASAIALTIGINQLVTVLKPHQKYLLFGLAASATTLTGSFLLAAASATQVQEFFNEQKAEEHSKRLRSQSTQMPSQDGNNLFTNHQSLPSYSQPAQSSSRSLDDFPLCDRNLLEYEKNLNSFRQEIERNWKANNFEPTCPQSNPQGKSEEAQSPQEAVIESLPNEKRYRWLTTQQLDAHWKLGDIVAPNSAIDKFDADLN